MAMTSPSLPPASLDEPLNSARRIAVFRTDPFTFPLPEGHRFPAAKYRLLTRSLMDQGIASEGDMHIPREAAREELRRVHMADYLDRYGRMALSKKGLEERDRQVLGFCRKHRLPIAVTMAGGYGRDIADTVAIHVQTVGIFRGSQSG
jgi:acetoin utilization deacetylase AcuC-like enzyme